MGGRVHLVLGAGGVRALAYVGVLQAFEAAEIEPEGVAACSAGTIIGALIAAGKGADEIESEVLDADLRGLARAPSAWVERIAAWRAWPFAPERPPQFETLVGNAIGRDTTFAQLKRPFATLGIDVVSGDFLAYTRETHPTMPVVDAVRIATALPLVYPPHTAGHRQVVDASIASRTPVWLAAAFEETLPIVVLRTAPSPEILTPRNVLEYVRRLVDATLTGRDALLIRGDPRVRTIDLPTARVGYSRFDLAREERARLIRLGRGIAERVIDEADGDFAALQLRVRSAAAHLPGGQEAETAQQRDEAAAWAGAHYAQRFVAAPPREIFVSYAHTDEEWRDLVVSYLRTELSAAQISMWSDREIGAGDYWKQEIHEAIGRARVALLIVSPDFLRSSFIAENELPALLSAAHHRRTVITWVHARDATFQTTPIAPLQAAHDPSRPLESLDQAERHAALATIAQRVAGAFTP
jgi:predicted acylesterase/phospholipase RssA